MPSLWHKEEIWLLSYYLGLLLFLNQQVLTKIKPQAESCDIKLWTFFLSHKKLNQHH